MSKCNILGFGAQLSEVVCFLEDQEMAPPSNRKTYPEIKHQCSWPPWSVSENPSIPRCSLLNVNHSSRVPFKYLNSCFAASQWAYPGFCMNCNRYDTTDERATSLSAEAPIFAPSSQVDRLVHSTFAALAQYSINGQPHPARLGATHSLMWAIPRHLIWKCSWQWTDAVIYRHSFSSTSWFAWSSHI